MGFSIKKFTRKIQNVIPIKKADLKRFEKIASDSGLKQMAVQGGLQALNTVVPGAGSAASQMYGNAMAMKAQASQFGAMDVLSGVGDVLLSPSTAHAPGLPVPVQGGVPNVMVPNHAVRGRVVPVGNQMDKAGRPLMIQPSVRQVRSVPRGYVVVRHPTMGAVGMLRSTAVSAGLYKPRKKAPISAGDWNKLKVADRVKANVKKVASTAGFTATAKGRRTVRK